MNLAWDVRGVGERNDNGRRFADMCLENGLVIGGTIFQHKTMHKLSWISPDGRTNNQIDHIAIVLHPLCIF